MNSTSATNSTNSTNSTYGFEGLRDGFGSRNWIPEMDLSGKRDVSPKKIVYALTPHQMNLKTLRMVNRRK